MIFALVGIICAIEKEVHIRHLEAGDLEVEVQLTLRAEIGRIRELDPQRVAVPAREFRQPVVGDPQRA